MPPVVEGVVVVLEDDNKGDKYLMSDALMNAVHDSNTASVKKLLQQGTLYACRMLGQDALAKAVEHGFVEAVKLMIDHGEVPTGNHLCSVCASGGPNSQKLVEILLDGGADPNAMTAVKPPFTAVSCMTLRTERQAPFRSPPANVNSPLSFRCTPPAAPQFTISLLAVFFRLCCPLRRAADARGFARPR